MAYIVTYDPSKEEPIPRAGALELRVLEDQKDPADPTKTISVARIFRLESVGVNGVTQTFSDDAIALLEKNEDWNTRLSWGAITVSKVADSQTSETEQQEVASSNPPTKVTVTERTKQLEDALATQGYRAIEAEAAKHGISKPSTGWKDAIPLIVQEELENGLVVD